MASTGRLSERSPVFGKVMVLNAHHITDSDTRLLPENPLFDCYEFEGGWWAKVVSVDHDKLQQYTFSPQFREIWSHAYSEACDYIFFAVDGPVIKMWNYHEW